MEEYLLEIIRTGENGNIYRCLVLKTDNQKLKVRDAWTWVQIWLLSASECERRGRLYVTTCVRTCRGLQEEKLDCWILFNFLFKFENKTFHPSFSIISLLLYLNIYLFLVLLFIIPQLWKLKQLIETLRDVLRRLLYEPKNFYPDKRLWRRDEMFRDEMFRDEMFWDEFYEPASGFLHSHATNWWFRLWQYLTVQMNDLL